MSLMTKGSQMMKSLLNSINTMTKRYLSKALIGFLSFFVVTAQADVTITYYHTDALGSVIGASDNDGNLVWTESYRPYGSRKENTAAATEDNDLYYTGKPYDDDLELSYYGARYYNPEIGRFMSMDPISALDGIDINIQLFNRYAYAYNNPYKFIDPDGALGTSIHMNRRGMSIEQAIEIGNFGNRVFIESGVRIAEGIDTVSNINPGKGATTAIIKKAIKGAANGPRAGKKHTRGAIKEAKKRNAAKNNGDVLCETCGVKTTPTTRRTKGSKVDPREGQGDHKIARSKNGDGATVKDQRNIDIKCASCNNKKSNN